MGVRDPESVAEHSYRTAVIGYILAALEQANPEKTAALCLFHDTAETRIGDLHWVTKRYLRTKEGEQVAFNEQTAQLPQDIADKVRALVGEYEERSSQEASWRVKPICSNACFSRGNMRCRDIAKERNGPGSAVRDYRPKRRKTLQMPA